MAMVVSTAATSLSSNPSTNMIRLNELTLPCFFPGKEKKNRSKRFSFIRLVAKSMNQRIVETRKESNGKIRSRCDETSRPPVLSEGREDDASLGRVCPGCGVFLQDMDPDLPGFYKERTIVDVIDKQVDMEGLDDRLQNVEDNYGEEYGVREEGDFRSDSSQFEAMLEDGDGKDEFFNGFAPAGIGYGNVTEAVLEREKKRKEERKLTKSERKRNAKIAMREREEVTVCARCHSLRNYGQVKNQAAENLIPDFDFDRLVTTRLSKHNGTGNATVIVIVVDCVDFDGSFPKRAAKSLFKMLENGHIDASASKKLPKIILVATKVDLLPSQVSPTRLDRWVRHRARAHGAPKLSAVYLVSSHKDLGVRNLLTFIKDSAGPRGNVWVIGAQNAGKSTLINSLAKKEKAKVSKLTEASIPGTTLGILRIVGLLPAKAKMYDTPGLLHPNLMSMRLNREEQKMIEIRKQLQPRTFRVKVGQAVHVGGLARLDLNQASVETIYITVWASPSASLHLGKLENADEFFTNHVGIRLQPPVGNDRASELGKWIEKEIKANGTSWEVNSMDISIAGLGWFSIGLKGDAKLSLWIYDGIEVTLREPLVLDRASFLERPGFWLPKVVSDSIGDQTKLESKRNKEFSERTAESFSDILM